MYVWPSSERNHLFSCLFNTMARWSPSSKRNGVKTRNRSSPSRTIRTLAQTFSRNDFSMTAVFMPPPHRRDGDWGRPASQTRHRPTGSGARCQSPRSEEHTSELQSLRHLVCRLLLEKRWRWGSYPERDSGGGESELGNRSGRLGPRNRGSACERQANLFFFKEPQPPKTYTLPLRADLRI